MRSGDSALEPLSDVGETLYMYAATSAQQDKPMRSQECF